MSDDIDVLEESSDDEMPVPSGSRNHGNSTRSSANNRQPTFATREPIIIKGVGSITMFGLNSRFSTEFPPVLTGRVAPEELAATLARVNAVLRRGLATNTRWLLCGLLCCCCSLGCSLWPVVFLNKRTVHMVEKLLDAENTALYHKLGLHWRLGKRSLDSPQRLTEHVLLLELMPKAPLLLPD